MSQSNTAADVQKEFTCSLIVRYIGSGTCERFGVDAKHYKEALEDAFSDERFVQYLQRLKSDEERRQCASRMAKLLFEGSCSMMEAIQNEIKRG